MTASTTTSSSDAAEAPRPLVQFNFEVDPDGDVAAYLPVRWCVDPERLLAEITRRGFKKPRLLICIQHARQLPMFDDHMRTQLQDTAYYIMPLKQELAYIAFQRPGTNRVLAVIVDVADRDQAESLYQLQRRGSPTDHDSLFHEDGTPKLGAFSRQGIGFIATGASQEVEVDPEMFASEPAAWRKRVVATFFESRPHDQCHFRKRFWFISMPLLLILVPITTVLKTITAFVAGIILGLYGVNYKCIVQPLELNPKQTVRRAGDSRWLRKKPVMSEYGYSRSGGPQLPVFWVINPVVMVLPAFVYFMFTDGGWWRTLIFFDLKIIASAIIFAVLVVIIAGLWMFITKVTGSESYQQRREARRLNNEHQRQQELEAMLKGMSCTIGARAASVDALPAEKRTIPLRFAKLKGEVCKPFAR